MGISDIRPAQLPEPTKRHNLRVSMGLTLTQLAAEVGCSESALRKWEGGSEPRGLLRKAYADALAEIEDYLERHET